MAVRLPGGMLSLLYGYGKLIVLALCRGRNRHEYLCPGAAQPCCFGEILCRLVLVVVHPERLHEQTRADKRQPHTG